MLSKFDSMILSLLMTQSQVVQLIWQKDVPKGTLINSKDGPL